MDQKLGSTEAAGRALDDLCLLNNGRLLVCVFCMFVWRGVVDELGRGCMREKG
jgi:hypothetical protein